MNQPLSDELISAYLDGELTAEEQARVEQTIAENPELRRMLDELTALRSTLQAMPRAKPSDDLTERILRQAERTTLGARNSNGSSHSAAESEASHDVREPFDAEARSTQDRSAQDRSAQDRSAQDRSAQDRSAQDRSAQDNGRPEVSVGSPSWQVKWRAVAVCVVAASLVGLAFLPFFRPWDRNPQVAQDKNRGSSPSRTSESQLSLAEKEPADAPGAGASEADTTDHFASGDRADRSKPDEMAKHNGVEANNDGLALNEQMENKTSPGPTNVELKQAVPNAPSFGGGIRSGDNLGQSLAQRANDGAAQLYYQQAANLSRARGGGRPKDEQWLVMEITSDQPLDLKAMGFIPATAAFGNIDESEVGGEPMPASRAATITAQSGSTKKAADRELAESADKEVLRGYATRGIQAGSVFVAQGDMDQVRKSLQKLENANAEIRLASLLDGRTNRLEQLADSTTPYSTFGDAGGGPTGGGLGGGGGFGGRNVGGGLGGFGGGGGAGVPNLDGPSRRVQQPASESPRGRTSPATRNRQQAGGSLVDRDQGNKGRGALAERGYAAGGDSGAASGAADGDSGAGDGDSGAGGAPPSTGRSFEGIAGKGTRMENSSRPGNAVRESRMRSALNSPKDAAKKRSVEGEEDDSAEEKMKTVPAPAGANQVDAIADRNTRSRRAVVDQQQQVGVAAAQLNKKLEDELSRLSPAQALDYWEILGLFGLGNERLELARRDQLDLVAEQLRQMERSQARDEQIVRLLKLQEGQSSRRALAKNLPAANRESGRGSSKSENVTEQSALPRPSSVMGRRGGAVRPDPATPNNAADLAKSQPDFKSNSDGKRVGEEESLESLLRQSQESPEQTRESTLNQAERMAARRKSAQMLELGAQRGKHVYRLMVPLHLREQPAAPAAAPGNR